MTISKSFVQASLFALMPVTAYAGGFDVTGQPIGIIFEEGNHIEATVGGIAAEVDGEVPLIGQSFGNVARTIPVFTGGAKFDFTDRISGAVILDRPFHRKTKYNTGLYVGTAADVEANTLTAVGRFKFNENFSVYGGPRLQRASIDLTGPSNPAFGDYSYESSNTSVGFVVGAAAEIPEYKIRAAITYNSEIDHDFDSSEGILVATEGGAFRATREGTTSVTTPQSVNLDLQAPVSETTLVQASVRWVNWDGVNLTPPLFLQATGRPVVQYTEDTFTYRLTVAQRLNDSFIGFVTGSYEADGGEDISLFKSVDGSMSLGGGVIFEADNGLSLRVAAEHIWLEGTSGAQIPDAGLPSTSFDGTAIAGSVKLAFKF